MKYKILFGFMILAFVTSCNNKNTNRGVNTRLNELGGTLNSGLTCVNGTSNVGTIYDANGGFSQNGIASFEDRVKHYYRLQLIPLKSERFRQGNRTQQACDSKVLLKFNLMVNSI